MKFPFKIQHKIAIWECLDEIDQAKLTAYLDSFKEGQDMELIIRKKIDWNATQMKRYFEGPVVNFVQELYAQQGKAIGEGLVREGLLGMFLGWSKTNEFGVKHVLSRTELDAPKDGKTPRERWIKFLKDIDAWCMDEFGCSLPSADNADIGD